MFIRNRFLFILSSVLLLGVAACGAAPSITPAAQASAADNNTAAADEETEDTYLPTVVGDSGGEGDSSTYILVDTGQGICYDDSGDTITCPAEGEAFYGQDAQYTGATFDFADNGDGTVTDNVTGLIWQQTPDKTRRVWSAAQSYCEDLSLAGSDDWRTPSLKELFSISDFESGWPYIDMDYFDLITTTGQDKQEQYWSDNYYEAGVANGMQSAFGVNHGTGHIKAYPDGGDGSPMAGKYVRCVQGDDYLVNDFVDNGDGTITDNASSLMWLQDDSGAGLDWASALAYADSFSYAGYDDWRVPSAKELQSIVDYSGVYPAIDQSYFNISDEDAYFWSSTSAYFSPRTPGYYYAWYVAFGYAIGQDGQDSHGAGAVRFDTKAEGGPAGEDPERIYNYVRLVRGGDVTETMEGDPTADDSVTFVESPNSGPDGQGGPEGISGSQPGPAGGQPDLAAAAAQLGITEETLREVLGDPSQGQPDFEAAAETLGITVEELQNALTGDNAAPVDEANQPALPNEQPPDANSESAYPAEQPTGTNGQPSGPDGQQSGPGGQQMPDLAGAAAQLGVTEEALTAALGDPTQGPPDFAAAAQQLGVTEAELLAALGAAGGGMPPAGGPPAGGQPPMNTP